MLIYITYIESDFGVSDIYIYHIILEIWNNIVDGPDMANMIRLILLISIPQVMRHGSDLRFFFFFFILGFGDMRWTRVLGIWEFEDELDFSNRG